ncbi:hypothetical protein ACFX2A_006715 [Malus domestica]
MKSTAATLNTNPYTRVLQRRGGEAAWRVRLLSRPEYGGQVWRNLGLGARERWVIRRGHGGLLTLMDGVSACLLVERKMSAWIVMKRKFGVSG